MKTFMLVLFAALVLIGCSGDDGDPAPVDITGYWEGGGSVVVDQVTYPIGMGVSLRNTGYGYYDAYCESQSGPYYAAGNEIWVYENGHVAGPNGLSGRVKGNSIELNYYLDSAPGARVEITLYRQ